MNMKYSIANSNFQQFVPILVKLVNLIVTDHYKIEILDNKI